MSIPVSASINQLNAEVFIQEGYELSLDAIVPSIELTGSFSPFESKVQFYIYDYSQTILYQNTNYSANGSFISPESGLSISTSTSSYNQFEINPTEDVYNQGYSSGNYYALYNFINYELGSEIKESPLSPTTVGVNELLEPTQYDGHPYFLSEISGDRTELRIQNNFLTPNQIESYYNKFNNKINARENVDEFYISFGNNRNFIAVNSQLETVISGSTDPTSILIKLYKPLPSEFEIDQQLQIISKVGETQVYSIDFQPNLEFIDNLLSLKGPNYNIDIKDRINNSTPPKNLNDLVNTVSSQSYYQFNNLNSQKGIILRKDWSDWSQFVKYSSARERLNNFKSKLSSIESYETELSSLETITGVTSGTPDYSSSYNNISNNINNIIRKFDSYEYFLYYITGSNSWPKYSTTYPYKNYSITSSAALNWFGSTNELDSYYNTGKNQVLSASLYDENNQDYLYYLIPPFITNNNNNNQYLKFVNMTGQTFDEMYLYTEAVEQVRNTNSSLTGDVLPLGLADEVIESLGFDTYGNDFNSIGFNINGVGVFPTAGSGLEYIDRYIDIASGSVINYYDQQESTLGYVIALADPSFPYPIDNAAQEIYKRIFHNMVSLVKRKGTVTGLRQLINIWGVPNTMLRISEFGGKNKDDENDYDLWMNRYSNAMSTIPTSTSISLTTIPKASGSIRIPWTPLTSNYYETSAIPDIAVPDCIQFRFKNERPISGDSLFTQSLLVKNSNSSSDPSDFAIVLQYSGSQSGSFSGSVIPTDYQYGTMQFVISGSVAQGAKSPGYFESDPISLPFFDGDWWSVQLQRKTHISASNQNSTNNEFELKVANNIYDGYDGNQIGFQGVSTITTVGDNGINEAWNKFLEVNQLIGHQGVLLGGYMNKNLLSGYKNKFIGIESTGRNIGSGFVGQFQEARYYRRALSSSQFNDYVMNPESIQGHSDSTTGAGSSYDLLSFRLPLGNELEYTNVSGSAAFSVATENGFNVGFLKFGGGFFAAGGNALGSIHPSLVNKKGSLYTSSFLNMTNYTTQSGYSLVYQGWDGTDTSAVTASYLVPNTEINYMDQPAAGIRNRIKNKIQVIDGNEYGTTLSPFRSIQQEFEQSSSYTEDLNSLEVGFSFQNEINDDIIGTFGHGVVSDAIADPRFISESSDRYPELTRIAEDYFKKYQGVTITDPTYNGGLPTIIEKEYDYNRLIKFYETSLFKAIKNYVPARTSLSTGIIVKQHLLERNKATAVIGVNPNTPIAKTPETGSNVYGYTDQTGFNSVISQRNLLITSSIAVGSLTGSAGGSVNKYNTPTSSYAAFTQSYNVLDPFTGDTITVNTQEEFYDGEFSGSNFKVIPAQYNPYRIFADGNNLNPDSSFPFTPPSLNLAATPFNTTRFPTVTANSAVAVPIQATASLVYPSGSNDGLGVSSDSLLFKSITNSIVTSITLTTTTFPGTLVYANIGDSSTLNTSNAQNKLLFISFAGGGLSNNTTVTLGGVPNDVTNVTTNISNGTKVVEAQINASGGAIGSCRILDNNPNNDNDTNWFVVGDTFTGFPSGMGTFVSFQITQTTMASGLVGIQFMNDATAAGTRDNLKSAIESSAGHNGTLIALSETNGSDEYLTLFQNSLGIGGNTSITYGSLFADNTDGVIEASRSTGASPQYLAPTTFQGGVDTPATSTTFLQNSITNLTPGVTYDIEYTISGIGNDGYGGPFDIGLSELSTPGGTPNGIGTLIRQTTNGTFTGQWVQAAGQTTAMFFAALGTYGTLSNVSITPPPSILGPKHFYPLDAFTIIPTGSQLFQNSPYNPIINNVSGSRPNERFLDMDFDPVTPGTELKEGIPNDYSLIVSASQLGFEGIATNDNLLEFAGVPESNYTILSSANPRYNGCLLESADYNFYTGIPSESFAIGKSDNSGGGITGLANPPFLLTQNKVQYINGETGSWTGDTSYGKTAVIDRNPINIAHFKSSLESKEYYNTTTFNIDQLIQIPLEEILNEQSPIITSSLINGSNENLIAMSSTFMPGREATIVYNQTSKTFNNVGGSILNYTNLGIGSKVVNAGGIEFVAYQSNERALDVLTTIQFYDLPKWYSYAKGLENINIQNNAIRDTFNSSSINLTSSIFSQSNGVNEVELLLQNDLSELSNSITVATKPGRTEFYTKSPAVVMAYTGSIKDSNNQDVGLLDLRGPNVGNIPGIAFAEGTLNNNALILQGQSLLLFNSINNLISLGDINKDDYVGTSFAQDYADNITIPLPAGGDPLGDSGVSNNASPMLSFPLIPSSQVIPNFFQDSTTTPSSIFGKGSLPILTQQDLEFEDNFFRWNISGSNLLEYRNIDNQKVLIEKGDEIRVSYAYFPNPSNTAITNKTYQDFTVLGYDQYPPCLWTSNFDPSTYTAYTDIRFEIACYRVDGYTSGIGTSNTETTFINPLPAEGYYSFSSLKEKYQAAMHNNVTMYWAGVEKSSGTPLFASGSIIGVSSRNELNGTGIIGITASWFLPDGSSNDFSLGENYGTMFGSNYILQDLQANQFPMTARDGGGFPLTTPVFMSSSINPMIQDEDGFNQVLDPGYLFNRLKVTPNPANLDIPILSGKIYAMTSRKRQEADDRVVLNVNQPSGSQGAQTLSGDGYLVPNDLTNIQQRNVQKLINKLKSENVFTPDSNDTQS